jgi:DNA mismatch repair protein MutL
MSAHEYSWKAASSPMCAKSAAHPEPRSPVHNLFYNTPARFKFLKSDQAEASRTSEMIGHLALAYPNVSFRLRHNGNEVLRAEAGGNPMNAVVSVLGREIARQMLPISEGTSTAENEVRIGGFVGRPQLTRANRNLQLFFVNGRLIQTAHCNTRCRRLTKVCCTVTDAFPSRHFPACADELGDVNVHPTKSEVRLRREWDCITRCAWRCARLWPLRNCARLGLQRRRPHAEQRTDRAIWPSLQYAHNYNRIRSVAACRCEYSIRTLHDQPTDYRGFHQPVAPRGGDTMQFRQAQQSLQGANNAQSSFPDFTPPPEEERRVSLKPLAQISNNAYILCEGDDGLYIVCQHRAHERILADKAIAAAEGRPVEAQRLVIPFTAEVGPRAMTAVEENASLLNDLGFEVEAFGGASVLVRAVPYLVAKGDYETAFTDLLDELISGHGGKSLQEKRRALLTMLSCKNAIKAGDALQAEQMKGLLDDLLQLPNPSICPHGQPILIKISTLELDKKFEREYASR